MSDRKFKKHIEDTSAPRPLVAVMSQIGMDSKGNLHPMITREVEQMMSFLDADWLIIPPFDQEQALRLLSMSDGYSLLRNSLILSNTNIY